METPLEVKLARLAVSTEIKLLRQPSNVQILHEMSSALFSTRVTKALAMSSGGQSPFAGAQKAKTLPKASRLKRAKKPTKGPPSGNDLINVGSFLAEVL